MESEPVWDLTGSMPGFRAAVFFYFVSIIWLLTSNFALDHFELMGIK